MSAPILGENGLVYIGTTRLPLANEFSISIEGEKVEAPRVFTVPGSTATKWVTKSPGYQSASGSISALYDDSSDTAIVEGMSNTVKDLYLYPDWSDTTHYWYGQALLNVSSSVSSTEHVTVEIAWESTGVWAWHSA